jgi:hypothetical protein
MTATSVATVDELLGMARDCYTQARDSLDPSTKRQLEKLGDDYLKQAQELRRDRYSHPGRISKI